MRIDSDKIRRLIRKRFDGHTSFAKALGTSENVVNVTLSHGHCGPERAAKIARLLKVSVKRITVKP